MSYLRFLDSAEAKSWRYKKFREREVSDIVEEEGTLGEVRSEIGDGSCEGGADVERVEFDVQGASDSELVLDATVAYRERGVFSKGLRQYVRFYNTQRPHSSHGRRTPRQMHFMAA